MCKKVLALKADMFENLSANSLKGDLSNATSFNPPLFSLVNSFDKTLKNQEETVHVIIVIL